MVIELANGGDGYIPPPEQYALGRLQHVAGTFRRARSGAEPKIAETALQLLERVAGRPRRAFQQSRGPACQPSWMPGRWLTGGWMSLPVRAVDASGHNRDAVYEPGVVFFLEGPRSQPVLWPEPNKPRGPFRRRPIAGRIAGLGDRYSVSLWFWNGMPVDGRPVTGWMFSRGRDYGLGPHGDHLGVGGNSHHPGKLLFLHGDESQGAEAVAGRSEIARWTWNHVLLVRDGESVKVYLNGQPEPEIDTRCPAGSPRRFGPVLLRRPLRRPVQLGRPPRRNRRLRSRGLAGGTPRAIAAELPSRRDPTMGYMLRARPGHSRRTGLKSTPRVGSRFISCLGN